MTTRSWLQVRHQLLARLKPVVQYHGRMALVARRAQPAVGRLDGMLSALFIVVALFGGIPYSGYMPTLLGWAVVWVSGSSLVGVGDSEPQNLG